MVGILIRVPDLVMVGGPGDCCFPVCYCGPVHYRSSVGPHGTVTGRGRTVGGCTTVGGRGLVSHPFGHVSDHLENHLGSADDGPYNQGPITGALNGVIPIEGRQIPKQIILQLFYTIEY